jgi:hypothetical protein
MRDSVGRTRALIRKVGQPVVFRRVTRTAGPAPVSSNVDTPLVACVISYSIQQMTGSQIRQGDRQCSISPLDLPIEPTTQDFVVIDGHPWTVMAVSVFTDRGQRARYDLQLRR